jgi:hypothetical protein
MQRDAPSAGGQTRQMLPAKDIFVPGEQAFADLDQHFCGK